MNVFEAAIGWIAPPECVGCGSEGQSLCRLCANLEILPYGEHCGVCAKTSPDGRSCETCRRKGAPGYIWIGTDYSGLSKKLLQRYKFHHQRAAAIALSEVMASTMLKYFKSDELVKRSYLVVPITTATDRTRSRGFDHASLLASQAAKRLNLDFNQVLGRLGQNRQVGATRSLRLKQQADNYIVRRPEIVAGRNILLVDDVITTGATLTAAKKALRRAGAKQVDALIFAKRI